MDKIYDLLLMIHNQSEVTQRQLAEKAELSLGTTNALLSYLEDHDFIIVDKSKARHFQYYLTDSGENKLKELLQSFKATKLQLASKKAQVTQAVILAAGFAPDFSKPACLVPINEEGVTSLERTLRLLNDRGVNQITIVVGYQKEAFEKFASPTVTLIENPDYTLTGTMSSLSKVFPLLEEDFILIDGDLVYEEYILDQLLTNQAANTISTVALSGSGDEAFVDMDEEDNLIRISKDIRQMNRLSAEMMGISKISRELLKEMKNLYAKNNNQWLNYEYLILQAAQTYEVKCVTSDNVAWGDLDDQAALTQINHYIWPTIQRHEDERQVEYAKEKLIEILNLAPQDISDIHFAGGMTNTNYQAVINGEDYFIRIPGKCTEVMINRDNEALNAQIGSALNINVDTLYINPQTGIKITKAVTEAETLSPRTARIQETMREVATILKNLHTADITFPNDFSFMDEWKKYEDLVQAQNVPFYPEYQQLREDVLQMTEILKNKYGLLRYPCHNDLVAENFVRDGQSGKLYLLDWEYSGMNDPSWDLAAFSIESELTETELNYFLEQYFGRPATKAEKQKVKMFQIYQDVLWSVWTIAKESAGVSFGAYGIDRYNRGKKQLEEVLADEQ
ncbi:phosphotransferase [Enterococcus timonensis]|uniref:phosphotransferase n=1 Tax=Enterococcus timonensis TaxID=1852364 RepID=UPI0008D9B215|nr:phosphotransferase [Enterococcus timonensis]